MNGEQKPKRTWVWVVVGVLFLVCVLAIGGIVFTVALFRQGMTVTEASESSATAQFEKVRAQFNGQKPLIQMVDRRPQFAPERAERPAAGQQPLKTLHVLAWDEDEGKVVSFSLPMWLLRLKSGPFRLSSYSEGWDDRGVSFSVEDLEKYGPGIVMDLQETSEGSLLVWVE